MVKVMSDSMCVLELPKIESVIATVLPLEVTSLLIHASSWRAHTHWPMSPMAESALGVTQTYNKSLLMETMVLRVTQTYNESLSMETVVHFFDFYTTA